MFLAETLLSAVSIIILKFDGSLQRSGDSWIGTYAACIHADDVLLGLGGRCLEQTTALPSSAIVEYEGLLYGLEHLTRLMHNEQWENHEIVVQGDCKTVIEQLKGRARPRKLHAYHQRAFQLIERNSRVISFEHIPREHNVLADELANCIADQLLTSAQELAISRLGEFAMDKNVCLDTCLSAFDTIDPPARLAILRVLARLCYRKRLHGDLQELVDKIREVLKDGKSLYHVSDTAKLDALVEAHVYQSFAVSADDSKQAGTFQRKSKHFLRTHSEDIDRIEKELQHSLERSEMECLLTAEIAVEPNDWSDPVQLWLASSSDWVDC